jgi:hypothetical protein
MVETHSLEQLPLSSPPWKFQVALSWQGSPIYRRLLFLKNQSEHEPSETVVSITGPEPRRFSPITCYGILDASSDP